MNGSIKTNITVLVITIAVLLVLGEMGIRILDWRRGHGFFSGPYRDVTQREKKPIIPYRIFGWQIYNKNNGRIEVSSVHGELYPLEKPVESFRIVAFGGSTTKNFYEGTHYPKLLEEKLVAKYPGKHIEVINVGNDAYSTTHAITLLAFDVISWKPDLVILSENINDLTASYFPGFVPDYSNKYGTKYYMPSYSERLTKMNVLFHWSSLYWFTKDKLTLLVQDREKEETKLRSESKGPDPLPKAAEVYRRNLTTFVSIAQANRIPVILATQPLEPSAEGWDFMMAGKDYNRIVIYPAREEIRAHHEKFNGILHQVAESRGAYFLDNNASFGGDKSFFVDSVHYNKKGLEKLAGNYFDLIVSKKLIEE